MSMAVQTSYGFSFPKGVPGGLYDLSAHEVSTRHAEDTGLSFGVGAVIGTNAGSDAEHDISMRDIYDVDKTLRE